MNLADSPSPIKLSLAEDVVGNQLIIKNMSIWCCYNSLDSGQYPTGMLVS